MADHGYVPCVECSVDRLCSLGCLLSQRYGNLWAHWRAVGQKGSWGRWMRAVAGLFCAEAPLLRMQLSSACRAQEPPQRVLSQRGIRKTTFLKSQSPVLTEMKKAAMKMEPKKGPVVRVQASTFRKSADAIDLDPSFSGPREPRSSVGHRTLHPTLPSHELGVLS